MGNITGFGIVECQQNDKGICIGDLDFISVKNLNNKIQNNKGLHLTVKTKNQPFECEVLATFDGKEIDIAGLNIQIEE